MENWGGEREREKKGYRSSALDVSGCAVRRYESQWHTLCSDCQRMPFDFNPPTTTTATTHRIFIGDVHRVACPDAPTHYDRVQVSTDRIFPPAIEFFPSLGIRLTDQFLAAILFGNRVFLNRSRRYRGTEK